jgi:hypothetical protein
MWISFSFLTVVFLSGLLFSASPYPPSEIFDTVIWHPSTLERRAPGSDNWCVTWGADDNMYASWGDGGGFDGTNSSGRVSLGVARMTGSAENFTGKNVWGGFNTENAATFDGKSLGILSVDGILYMWRGPGSGFTAWATTYLAWSDDTGATWQMTGQFFSYTDGFCKPTFLNFNKDYANARDTFVYIYAPDGSGGSGATATKVNFARVSKNRLRQRSAYEFFRGLDTGGNPLWTSDVSQSQPVMVDPNGVSDSPSVIFHLLFGRYIMTKTFGPHGGLGIFEATEPWGPWKTIIYTDNWRGSINMYFATIPTKWLGSNGLDFYMIFTGYGSDVIAQDAYQHIRGELVMMPIAVEEKLGMVPHDGYGFAAYPNPFSTSVLLELRNAKRELRNIHIGIYDIAGKLVYRLDQRISHSVERFPGYAWHASGTPPGVYVVRAQIGNSILSKKIELVK